MYCISKDYAFKILYPLTALAKYYDCIKWCVFYNLSQLGYLLMGLPQKLKL